MNRKPNFIYTALLILLPLKLFSQIIPDGDMENWTSFPVDTRFYEEPSSGWWATMNPLSRLAVIAPITVTKVSGSDAHSGYAARLATKGFVGMIIPGVLCAGIYQSPSLTNPLQTLLYGRPFILTPQKLSFYYKYIPANNDSCGVYLLLYRYNQALNHKDTIADMGFTGGATSGWQYFEQSLNYHVTGLNPDSIIINFSSSAKATGISGGEDGSALYIDDIILEDHTGIKHTMMPDIIVNIFPNPAVHTITFELSHLIGNEIAKIYSSSGLQIKNFAISRNKTSLDISGIAAGYYFISIFSNGKLLNTSGFEKK